MEKSNRFGGCALSYDERWEEIWLLALGLLVRWSSDSTLLLVAHGGRSPVSVEMVYGVVSGESTGFGFPITGEEVSAWGPSSNGVRWQYGFVYRCST